MAQRSLRTSEEKIISIEQKKIELNKIEHKKKCMKVAVSFVAAMFLVALYVTVFRFSGQEGEESGKLSHKVTKTIVNEVDRVAKKHWTDSVKESIVRAWEHPVRKMAHFSEYAAMAILVYLIWFPWIRRGWRLNILVIAWVFLSAALDEYHQSFVAMRSGNFVDVLIDTSGGCFGLLLTVMVRRIWGFLHGRKSKGK